MALFPLHEKLKGHASPALLRSLERSQWWSAERLAEQQTARLRAFLTRVGEHVPYYRRVFAEAGFDPRAVTGVDALRHLPLLGKPEIRANFEDCNAKALGGYGGEKAALYAGLKLSGLAEAPVQLAVFADEETGAGAGLGRQTMPETLRYSAVLAVHTLWLAARAQGLGVGWVSILDPARVAETLDAPAAWSLVAYLCLGYPVEEHVDPELERFGWQAREAACRQVLVR